MFTSRWPLKNHYSVLLCVSWSLIIQIFLLNDSWSQCTSCQDCPPPIIGSTTKQLNVNGTQGLSASGGAGGPYSWSIVNGGGSLSGSSGTSNSYTAPTSNANCAGNPVIRLTDSCNATTDMSLAVNALYEIAGYYASPTFVTHSYEDVAGGCAGRNLGYCTYQVTKRNFGCNGTLGDSFYGCSPGHFVTGCTVEEFWEWGGPGCDIERAACISTNCPDGCAAGRHDMRTSAQIGAGCCPADTIPCLAEIKGFNTTTTKINLAAGGATSISATIPTPSGGGTVDWTLSLNGMILQQGTNENVSVDWDGRDASGRRIQPGTYSALLQARTSGGGCTDSTTQSTPITVTDIKDICLNASWGSLVNVASGNLHHDQSLFSLPHSKFQKDFVLSYNSFDGQSAPLGLGWTHTYNLKLLLNNNNSYTVVEGDGRRMTLYPNGGRYKPEGAAYPALTVNGNGTYTLEYKEGIFYQFNANKIITAVTDRNANSLTFGYDGQNNLTSLTDPSGRVITLTYDQDNRVASTSDPNGNTHSFSYSNGLLTGISSQIAGLGTRTWSYTYDGDGFLLTKTDPGNQVTTYTYDNRHRVSQVTDPELMTKSIAYSVAPSTSRITEKDGGLWTYKYDPAIAALTEKTDPLGNTTKYTYDASRNLVTVTDPRNKVTTYYYDGNGNVTMAFKPAGYNVFYSYNTLNRLTQVSYPGNSIYNLSYDAQGNLLSITEPQGNMTSFTYDANGSLLTQVNALSQTTTFAYNAAFYPTSITEPNGAVTTLTYDNAGNIVSVLDPLNNLYALEYNGLNRIKRLTNPQNQVTTLSYDAKGNRVSQTDANGKVTQYSYNYNNRVTGIMDALNQTTLLTYGSGCPSCGTGVDKLTSLTDPRGQSTTFEYDLAGRLIRETNPLGYFKSYTYDAAGNILSRTDESNQTTQYTYDDINRLTQVRYPNSTTVVLGYDGRSNLTSAANPLMTHYFSYDLNNRLTSQMDMYGKTIYYQYDGLNRRAQMTAPDGRVFTYSYNTGNRLSQIVAASRTYGFTHDLAGQRTGLADPNGVTTTYAYTPDGFLNNVLALNSQQVTIDSFAYTHDALGRRTSLTDLAGLHTYQYDDIYQLTQATHPTPPTEQFSYDAVGNRLGTTVDLNNALLEDSEFTYTYDYNDNLIQKVKKLNGETTNYTYDYENRLTRVQYPGMDAQYKYDALGRRIEKNVNGQVTTYVYDGLNMVADYNGLWTVRSKYVFGLDIDEPLSVDQAGSLYYYHQDGLGSVNELTDASRKYHEDLPLRQLWKDHRPDRDPGSALRLHRPGI